jgi:hypothetical protein
MSLVDLLGSPLAQLYTQPLTSNVGTTTVTKVTNVVTPTVTSSQKAALAANTNLKMGTLIRATDLYNKIVPAVQARAITNVITKAGYSIVPKTSNNAVVDTGAVGVLTNQLSNQVSAQSTLLSNLSSQMDVLAKGTVQGTVAQAQLATTTKAYEAVVNTTPAATSTDIFGQIGDFINKYGLYIVIGFGAIIFLPMITKLIPQRTET